jgi:hypothetical protein
MRLAKRKIPQLVAALKGHRLSDAHRFLIEHCLQHMAFLEQAIEPWSPRTTAMRALTQSTFVDEDEDPACVFWLF